MLLWVMMLSLARHFFEPAPGFSAKGGQIGMAKLRGTTQPENNLKTTRSNQSTIDNNVLSKTTQTYWQGCRIAFQFGS